MRKFALSWSKANELSREQLGQRIDALCYPYGEFDARVQAAARDAGYLHALAIFEGVSLGGTTHTPFGASSSPAAPHCANSRAKSRRGTSFTSAYAN